MYFPFPADVGDFLLRVWDDLQEEPNADASCPVFVVFRPHDQAEKLPVRRDLISIGKSNLQCAFRPEGSAACKS